MFRQWRKTTRRSGYRAAGKPLLPNLRISDSFAAPIAASIGRLHQPAEEFSLIPAVICAIPIPAAKNNCLSMAFQYTYEPFVDGEVSLHHG
jgi:hypothetical protein